MDRVHGAEDPAADMIPIADERPVEHVPWMTIALITLCFLAYFGLQPGNRVIDQLTDPTISRIDEDATRWMVAHAAIPCELRAGRPLTHREYVETFEAGRDGVCREDDKGPAQYPGKAVYLALLTSMFLHGSVPHLFGNMLFLWVFGNDIEHRWGRWRYALLYLLAGVAATAAHVVTGPNSTVPIIGASGAIAGVMGAYLVCYPTVRIKTMVFVGLLFLRKVKAYWLLGIFVVEQFLLASGDTNVAWAAHLGGFGLGALVGLLWRSTHRMPDSVRR